MGFFDDNEEWKRQRLHKFTSSKINLLTHAGKKGEYFGVQAKKYIRQVRGEIITLEIPEEITGIRAMEWGHMYEGEAISDFIEQTGFHVEHFGNNNPKFFPHPIWPQFAGGSPDGMAEDGSFIVEVKCPSWAVHDEYFELKDWQAFKDCEPDYYGQVQFNMRCAGVKNGYFISYHPLPKFDDFKRKIIPIPYDQAYLDNLEERLEKAIEMLNDGIWGPLFDKWNNS